MTKGPNWYFFGKMVGKDHSVKLLLHFAQQHFIPYISFDNCLCQADFIQYISNSNYWDGHIETAQWWFGGWFGDARNRVKSFVLRSKVNTQILQLMLSWEIIWHTQSRHLEHEITLFLHQVLSFLYPLISAITQHEDNGNIKTVIITNFPVFTITLTS